MNKPPAWFYVVAGIALLWNFAGLLAVVGDLRLSAADLAALSPEQQAVHAARPLWSVVGSVVAVAAGTLGCVLLLVRKHWAILLFGLSLAGVVVQDLGIFVVAGAAKTGDLTPVVLQSLVLFIALGLLVFARRARARAWIA
jgi:hypothetical protein